MDSRSGSDDLDSKDVPVGSFLDKTRARWFAR
jgi:hypothetical protein